MRKLGYISIFLNRAFISSPIFSLKSSRRKEKDLRKNYFCQNNFKSSFSNALKKSKQTLSEADVMFS
jgi:hypothetical protein